MAADVIGRDFTQVYNRAARDRRLSRRARGLLLEILSHRDGFGVSMASLLAGGPEKEHALTSALHELERYGYLHRERERRPDGTFGDTIFSLTDMPDGVSISAPAPWDTPEEPNAQNPRSEPEPENQGLEAEKGNRRSEPDCDFPSQAQPGLGNPVHKKTNSSCGAEDSLSPARHTRDGSEPGEDEREAAAPEDDPAPVAGAGGVPGPREDTDGSKEAGQISDPPRDTDVSGEAVTMLVGLPGTVTEAAARKLVPLALAAVAAGWTLPGLRAHLAKLCDPQKVRYAPAVYEKHLRELPAAPAVRPARDAGAGFQVGAGMCARHLGHRADDCTPCDHEARGGDPAVLRAEALAVVARVRASLSGGGQR
ncbi:hypothetical protein ABZ069_36350 [Streptomyces microflavus]|uniref:hypothetical protein n=1 Tax=Streptomyces microflavus TaxID=1919 RepID=UPI0033B92388